MQQVTRREIAPSRWAYRMQRLWLTPVFRVLFRVGLPSVVLMAVVGIYVSDQGRRDAVTQMQRSGFSKTSRKHFLQ